MFVLFLAPTTCYAATQSYITPGKWTESTSTLYNSKWIILHKGYGFFCVKKDNKTPSLKILEKQFGAYFSNVNGSLLGACSGHYVEIKPHSFRATLLCKQSFFNHRLNRNETIKLKPINLYTYSHKNTYTVIVSPPYSMKLKYKHHGQACHAESGYKKVRLSGRSLYWSLLIGLPKDSEYFIPKLSNGTGG